MTDTTPAGASPADSALASTPVPVQPSNEQTTTPASSAAAPAEQAKTEPGAPAAEQTEAGQGERDEHKPKSRFQDRIDQLTAQKREAEARAVAAEMRLRSLRQLPEMPDRELSFEEQESLRVRQAVRQERAEETALEAEQNARAVAAARLQMFEAKVEAVADRMPDLREKFSAVPVSNFAADFIAESERAAEIAYFLGSNPREAVRIANLPDTRQAVELARLEAKLSAAPSVRKISQAPTPPPMVTGTAAPGPKDPADMSDAEYSAWYRERQKAGR